MITEIKIDISTLPQEEQRVRFHLPSEGWKEGIYLAKEQMFSFDDGKFHYAWEVSEWESMETYPKWNLALVKKLVSDSEKYPVGMRIVAELHRRGIVKSESDLYELLYKSGHFNSMGDAMKNGLLNEYQNMRCDRAGYAINEIPKP